MVVLAVALVTKKAVLAVSFTAQEQVRLDKALAVVVQFLMVSVVASVAVVVALVKLVRQLTFQALVRVETD
jgi:hypothetical protein